MLRYDDVVIDANIWCTCPIMCWNSTIRPTKAPNDVKFPRDPRDPVRIPDLVYGTVRFVSREGRKIFVSSVQPIHKWNPGLVRFPTRCRTCSTNCIQTSGELAVRGMSILG